jgi:methylornithine synthase
MTHGSLNEVLDRAWNGRPLTNGDIKNLLALREEDDLAELFQMATSIKERRFGNRVFLYGFVYFSTYCRNNCSFCFYRNSNKESVRYRKTLEDIVTLASALEDAGVHMIDLTMGEDPFYHGSNKNESLLEVVSSVNNAVHIPIMASPGVLSEDIFLPMREAGADWFACYQETHNRDLFSRLRPQQDYDLRYNQKIWARRAGMLTEEGIMIGVGETIEDRAESLQMMGVEGVQQVRAMTFVPQLNTPMEERKSPSFTEELVTLAVMRLVHQDKLIPASLDIEGVKGLKPRLDAGANVITSIIPSQKGLAGVAQHELDINTGERSPGNVENILADLNVTVASRSEYQGLIDDWKQKLLQEVLA